MTGLLPSKAQARVVAVVLLSFGLLLMYHEYAYSRTRLEENAPDVVEESLLSEGGRNGSSEVVQGQANGESRNGGGNEGDDVGEGSGALDGGDGGEEDGWEIETDSGGKCQAGTKNEKKTTRRWAGALIHRRRTPTNLKGDRVGRSILTMRIRALGRCLVEEMGRGSLGTRARTREVVSGRNEEASLGMGRGGVFRTSCTTSR